MLGFKPRGAEELVEALESSGTEFTFFLSGGVIPILKFPIPGRVRFLPNP